MKSEMPHVPQGEKFPERTWLLVDDNEEILATISALFEALTGATIECHSTPKSALRAFAAAPEKYELVVTDYEMPGMSGLELCRRLKALVPDQKIILATGSYLFTLRSARNVGFSGLLNKPFRPTEMVAALADVGIVAETACAA
jgi:two-component system cell cycle sensor histidine kinase/response regulator CckA